MRYLHPQFGNGVRHQGGGAAHDHLGTQFGQAVNIAARYPAMSNVADQAYREVLQSALELANGEDVEQTLSGMLVRAVAGINDTALQMFGQKMWCAGRRVPDHHDVDAHGLDVLGSVDECFSLAQAGAAGREIKGVGAEPPRRQAKAGSRPGGRLEEQVDHDLAAQSGAFLAAALAQVDKILGRVENG